MKPAKYLFFLIFMLLPGIVLAADDIEIKVEEKITLISDPHRIGSEGCRSCHVISKEGRADKRLISPDINKVCNNCHGKGQGHFVDPFPYDRKGLQAKLRELGQLGSREKLNCVVCHDKHAEVKNPFYLVDAVYGLYSAVKRINPHWREGYCFACHKTSPKRSAKSFKYQGDLVKVCNNCHGTISIDSYIHAVGMTPSDTVRARMPMDFNLSDDGKISCTTCHNLSYQCLKKERHRKRQDKLFFRGGPYANRTDLCYKCHIKEQYETLNPHDQISDEGELNDGICLYCHEEEPDPQKDKGITQVKFVMEELKDLCLRCHRERAHPGGKWINFDHLVTPPKKIMFFMRHTEKMKNVALPLEPGTNKIFCCTCHNPHEKGVLRGGYDKGADSDRRLRLGAGFEICDACHVGKGTNEKRF
ncbi:MAG: hypothetical protein IMF07_07715 [Proteobacteria bacterium]|nr:hypothetical protein [Pseudomonadota bacterium]